jgi:hypothetical protein
VATNDTVEPAGEGRPAETIEIPRFYLPAAAPGGTYAPRLYGAARVHFADRRRKIDERRRVAFVLALEGSTRTVDWDAAHPTPVMPEDLLKDPPAPADQLPLPRAATEHKSFTRWARAFDRWLARTQRYGLPVKPDGLEPPLVLAPKRGGVSVELVAIAWELT